MAGARDIEAGRAFVRVSVKENMAGLKAISNKLKTWGAGISKVGAGLAGLGGAVLAPLAGMASQFSDSGDAVQKAGIRMGASAEFVSALSHAANLSAISMESTEKAFLRMSRAAYEGSDAFDALGVNVRDSSGSLKDSEQLFMETTDALSRLDNDTAKAALAMEVFGRSGAELLPMLQDGKDGIAAMMKDAARLGLVLSTEDANAAAALNDALGTMKSSLKAVSLNIGSALAPALTGMATQFAEIFSHIIAWVKLNRPLVVTIAKVAAVVTAAGGALMGIGGVLAATGLAMSGLATVIGAVLSPLGLLTAAIAAGTAALFTFTDAGRWLTDTFAADFGSAFETIKQTITGVTDALKAGEFQLAGEIAMTGLKLAFFEATKSIRTKWIEFNKSLVEMLIAAGKKMVDVISNVRKNITYLVTGFKTSMQEGSTNAALADLDERKGSLSKRDYMVQRSEILENGAHAMRNIITDAEGKLQDIDGDMARWKAGMDEFGNVMDENLNQQLADGQDRIAALREELNKLTGVAGDKAARIPRPEATKPEDVASNIRLGMASAGITGTFSAHAAMAAFAGPQADDAAKQTAEHTKRTAKAVEKLAQRAEASDGAVFA